MAAGINMSMATKHQPLPPAYPPPDYPPSCIHSRVLRVDGSATRPLVKSQKKTIWPLVKSTKSCCNINKLPCEVLGREHMLDSILVNRFSKYPMCERLDSFTYSFDSPFLPSRTQQFCDPPTPHNFVILPHPTIFHPPRTLQFFHPPTLCILLSHYTPCKLDPPCNFHPPPHLPPPN